MASPKVHDEHEVAASSPEVEARFVALRKAAAASRLEGLNTSPAVKALGAKWARGELSSEELMEQARALAFAELSD